MIQSFENQDAAHAPLRSIEGVEGDYQLLIDIRAFQVAAEPAPVAEIGLSARLLGKNGRVVAARLFEGRKAFERLDPPSAVQAFNAAFGAVAADIVGWTATVTE